MDKLISTGHGQADFDRSPANQPVAKKIFWNKRCMKFKCEINIALTQLWKTWQNWQVWKRQKSCAIDQKFNSRQRQQFCSILHAHIYPLGPLHNGFNSILKWHCFAPSFIHTDLKCMITFGNWFWDLNVAKRWIVLNSCQQRPFFALKIIQGHKGQWRPTKASIAQNFKIICFYHYSM